MFKKISSQILDKRKGKYLSFPDILKSVHNEHEYFVVYREGDAHHPTYSKLILLKSEDIGKTWKQIQEFPMTIQKNGRVWNCPRLSYNKSKNLCIICDTKDGTYEPTANFATFILVSENDGDYFVCEKTDIPGMLPDHFVLFKGNLFCANHKIKKRGRTLLNQLISWSRDGGKTWYDTNLIADSNKHLFCEASVVNVKDEYLLAYLRDNSGHVKNIYTSRSENGIIWTEPEPLPSIFGQRPSAIMYNNDVICSFRNTFFAHLSVFYHDLSTNEVKVFTVDKEKIDNLYHFGYSGITNTSKNEFFVVYYIQNNEDFPFIKLSKIRL